MFLKNSKSALAWLVPRALMASFFKQYLPKVSVVLNTSKHQYSHKHNTTQTGAINDFYKTFDQIFDNFCSFDLQWFSRFGLDKRTLAIFRKEGCQANATLQRIPLLGGLQRAQTRTFFFLPTRFAIVLSSGSGRFSSLQNVLVKNQGTKFLKVFFLLYILVSSGSSSATLASSPGVIYFGDTGGSFTFNPLANWPVVVLQGYYVLATYGVIIIWALILGAIIWGISISQFSGLFSGKFIPSHLCYKSLIKFKSNNSYLCFWLSQTI